VCGAKVPKVSQEAAKPKDPAIIRNPFLDGVDPTLKSLRLGRSALRIERGGVRAATPATPPPVAPPAHVAPSLPVGGITSGGGVYGGVGGGGGRFSNNVNHY
jgi:hypothetical protein